MLKDCRNLVKQRKIIAVLQQNRSLWRIKQRHNQITYKVCYTTSAWPICAKEKSRMCWDESSNHYGNGKSVSEIINEVDAMVGNTASIEGQGPNVRNQQRNKKSPG